MSEKINNQYFRYEECLCKDYDLLRLMFECSKIDNRSKIDNNEQKIELEHFCENCNSTKNKIRWK